MSDSRYNVLYVDDEASARELLLLAFSEQFDFTLAQTVEQIDHHLDSDTRFDLLLLDLELEKDSGDLIGLKLIRPILAKRPGLPIVVITKDENANTLKTAQDNGATAFLLKAKYNYEEWTETFEKVIKTGILSQIQDKLQRFTTLGSAFIGDSAQMVSIRKTLEAVSKSPGTPVMIMGETGTGKEAAAKYLHSKSPRRIKPLTPVNLSSIPPAQLEIKLFGAVKGTTPEALRDIEGVFREANNGILLLDEIGDISQDIQIKLLRFLEDHKIRPVGGDRDIQLDIQIIAATHRNLPELVRQGTFREDLYQRLKAITITLPPLRERTEDISLLFQHFFGGHGVKETLLPEVWHLLEQYQWPGNVRELRHAVQAILIQQMIEEKHLIDATCLPDEIRYYDPAAAYLQGDTKTSDPTAHLRRLPRLEALALLNMQYIENAMQMKNKVKQDVAEMLKFKSADSLLYEIKTCYRDYPYLFEGDTFPRIKAAYPQIFT